MKIKVKKTGNDDRGNELPKELLISADTEEEMELLLFIESMHKSGGFIPTLDKVIELIDTKKLQRVGERWVLSCNKEKTDDSYSGMMYG